MYKPIIKSLFIFSAFFFVFHFARAGATISGINSGLVGYYKFEEGAGTIIHDSSGNRNHGTTTNMANPPTATSGWTDGKFGKALAFDGSNDYTSVSGKNFDSSQELSVAAWIYDKDSSNQKHSINRDDNQAGERIWIIRQEDNSRVNWHIWNSSNTLNQFTPSNSWTVNKWFFFVGTAKVVSSNIVMEVFFNGQSAGTITFAGTAIKTNPSVPLRMGHTYKKQMLDEVRIYNRALTASEVSKLYKMGASKFNAPQTKKLTNGLVGYWTFDGKDIVATSSANYLALDKSGNNNHGTAWNNPLRAPGKLGQALKFNGVNSHINLGNSLLSYFDNGSDSFTFSAWIKTSSKLGQFILVDEISSRSPFFGYSITNGKLQLNFRDSSLIRHYSTGTKLLNDNIWHYVVGVRDGTLNGLTGSTKLFVDGVSDPKSLETLDGSVNNISYGDPVIISSTGWSSPFKGLIDEVRIYNRALSASEVKRLYNTGR